MASASESRNVTSEETEVTSERRPEEGKEERELGLGFPVMRQSSIYSLTLDEIQNTVCEPGKSFGSMNMDEFLTNIWNVEEGHIASASEQNQPHIGGGGPLAAPPLQRQGSVAIPAPLCRKTVDEVWADIHRGQNARRQNVDRPSQQQSNGAAPRKPTFGEITLEDFLVKAGVVREGYEPGSAPSAHAPVPPATQYGMPAGYQMVGPEGAPVFGHMVGVQAYGDHQVAAANGMYSVCGDGGGPGYAVGNGFGGRAYTVELEAELNQLKEENARLKEEEKKMLALKKQLLMEAMAERARVNAQKTSLTLRRCNSSQCSCPSWIFLEEKCAQI
ncbi:ABSCISIC ACID-INSENSITIVE 5-like protein 7 [Cocos nucifera]|uniref:ABSCISIC ACID-INSENSITIVE 5-like protein 7 n=1 Tax=Cocos nucifera TaxID=13894 RepID=A0A8K0I1D3_COCNU|nr:ABSCISIC ACID-INSENSITIVE 5-like protein 7 [Cocos nucifera]